MKRILFVDGSNLYGGINHLMMPGEYFDFSDLLSVIEEDLPVDGVEFYGTYMKEDSGRPLSDQMCVKAQKEFFDSAKNNSKVRFFEGKFSGSGKEKGVDVGIAVDMVFGAARRQFDEAIIMTGDADLTHAVNVAKRLCKAVHMVAFSSRFPLAIAHKAMRCILYDYDKHFVTYTAPMLGNKVPNKLEVKDITKKLKIKTIKRPGA